MELTQEADVASNSDYMVHPIKFSNVIFGNAIGHYVHRIDVILQKLSSAGALSGRPAFTPPSLVVISTKNQNPF
jgi:hypothetical protein